MAPPPAPGLSRKPYFPFPEQPSKSQQITSKSHSNSICKTLIVLVLILVIPFFPSQAPDFIRQTISTELWEIVHLIFIGIAVSYGLFGRKTEKIEISRDDGDSNAYLSGISHLSSIFEDGFGNICCGPDDQEQDMMQSHYANCQCFGDQFLGKSRCVVHGGSSSTNIRSFREREKFCDSNGKNVNQTWSSKYLKSESLVVVSNGESFDFEPLNLPVRSLRSNVVVNYKPELYNRNYSSLKIVAGGKNDVEVKEIRGMLTSMNLENKFEEADGSSAIPWRSKSAGRMENREESSNIKPCAHCRPHSTGNFEFDHIKSRSNNKGSKFSSSTELESTKVGNVEGEKGVSVSPPKTAPLNDEVLFSGSRARPLSIDNNFEEDKVGKGKQPIDESLYDSDTKSLALAKSLSRARSVRTIKPADRYVTNHQNEQYWSRIDGFEANSFVKRGKRVEPKNPLVNHKHEEIDRHFSMPKPKPSLPDFFNEEEMEDIVEQNVIESEEEEESELNDEDDVKTNIDCDLGSEVDRKAGEFIAKFREQIRLQKTSSVEGYSRELL